MDSTLKTIDLSLKCCVGHSIAQSLHGLVGERTTCLVGVRQSVASTSRSVSVKPKL